MADRKVAMISSSARDLPEHREQVRLACERVGFAPREMMERLTARETDALDISLRMIEDADVYIGIFAYRYGYVPEGHDISLTEIEYNRAVELNKPRLIFFIHQDHPITLRDVETGTGERKLLALKDRIGKERTAFFTSAYDLRAQVVEALQALNKRLDRASPDTVSRQVARSPKAIRIFISYRRADASHFAGRLYDRLATQVGPHNVFMDVDAIPLGNDIAKAIQEAVSKCNVLLAIIGSNWLSATDKAGKRRLENANDFVRVEISTALARDVLVVPILMEDTEIPWTQDLPGDLQKLALRRALNVRHESFHTDIDKLFRELNL